MPDYNQTRCPICQGAMTSKGVRVSLETDIAVIDGNVVKLGRKQAEVLFILSDRPHVFIKTDDLERKTYGLQPGGGPSPLFMIIKSLREILEPTNWRIITSDRSTRSKGCGGYMLTREMLSDINPEMINACADLLTSMGLEKGDTDETVRSILSKLKNDGGQDD